LIWTHGVSAYATQRTNGEGRKLFSGVTEIKTMPYVPLSHPFVERLIGALRRECLDRTLFWTATDLEAKLLDFQHYYNEHRTHAGRQGPPPVTGVNADHSLANLSCYRWQKHCRGLYQTPMAA
jgi:putative transposase